MSIWRHIKAFLYMATAIAIFIFHKDILGFVGYAVGGIVFVYSLEETAVYFFTRRSFDPFVFCDCLSQFLIGALLMLTAFDTVTVCVIWGIWAILREAKELAFALERVVKKGRGYLSTAESVAVIVLSVFLVLNPDDAHAQLHIILLGVELLTVILFSYTEVFFEKSDEKSGFDRIKNAPEIKI